MTTDSPTTRIGKPYFLQRHHGTLREVFPGFLVVALVALAAGFVSEHYGGPVMLYALLLGMACNFLAETPKTAAGIFWSSKHVLHLGVALLGARMGVDTFAALGLAPVATVLAGVMATIGFGIFLARRMGLGAPFGMLSGGATAICGASAALAIASIQPRRPDSEAHTLLTIVVITALSTLCMILYPLLVPLLGLDDRTAGVFLGATIHDVAQVVGAGYIISDTAGDTATLVKLLRVAMLVPVCLVLVFALRRAQPVSGTQTARLMPWFLLAFVLLAAARSFHLLPDAAITPMTDISRWCLIIAITAIGMKTSLGDLRHVGWKPIALITCETLFLLGVVLASLLLANHL